MSSPEVITRIKELTTPAQGETDISYALVIPANKGSYEPLWCTGINEFKQRYTPKGVFETSSASPMYAAKKYFEAGDAPLLCVRPNTGALMAGARVLNGTPSVNFVNVGLEGTTMPLGSTLTYNQKSYFTVNRTAVPEVIDDAWLEENFQEVEASGEVKNTLIDFNGLEGFRTGTTLYFAENPSTMEFSNLQEDEYPAYFAVLPNNTLEDNDLIFGWYQNSPSDSVHFGYAVYTEVSGQAQGTFVEDTPVVINKKKIYTLEKDIICGADNFWTKSSLNLEISYDYIASIQLQTNVETYTAIKNTGIFTEYPQAETVMEVGEGLWYAGTPYLCAIEATVPIEITAAWINYYFIPVGTPLSTNFESWDEGVNKITEYEQADDELFTIYCSNGGLWGNGISFTIINFEDDPDEIEVEGCFILTFYNNGVQQESYTVSRQMGKLDANGNSMYIEDVVNRRSEDFKVKDNLALPDDLLPNTILTPVYLTGGANGKNPTDADMIKALNLMADETVYPLFAVGDGGYTTVNYAKAIQSFVDQRDGTKGVVCVPQVASVAATMAKAYNNIAEYMVSLNMSNPKMRVDEYWGYEFDPDTGRNVLIPPDGCYIRNEALTKRNEGLFFPNAGWQNGVIDVDVVNKWSKAYRDLLDKTRVNYAKYDRNRGTCIFSEQTSYALPSYRQQDHIEKVLRYLVPTSKNTLEKFLLRLAETGIFNQIVYAMDAIMQVVQDGHGCTSFTNICDMTNNSPASLDRQEVNVYTIFTPINSIKTIKLTYFLANQTVTLADVYAAA